MTLPAYTMSNFAVSRKRLAFLCAAVSVVLLVVFFVWAGNRNLFAVTGQDNQRFTELYFTNSESIPLTLQSDRQYTVPFAIANHEGVPKQYAYQVVIAQGLAEQRQPIQRLTLQDGERAVRDVQFSPPHVTEPVSISVKLQQSNQTITFRVEP